MNEDIHEHLKERMHNKTYRVIKKKYTGAIFIDESKTVEIIRTGLSMGDAILEKNHLNYLRGKNERDFCYVFEEEYETNIIY